MREDLIPKLIAIFAREAFPRLSEMNRCLGALEHRPDDVAAMRSLAHQFHSFAGVGGVDGFDVINSLGARGEDECREVLARMAGPAVETLFAWRRMVEDLADAVRILEASASASEPSNAPLSPP